jgi:hypothetical protein
MTCGSNHECGCTSSNYKACGKDSCVPLTACCPGDEGKPCKIAANNADGVCDRNGQCGSTCTGACADSLYKPCSTVCVSPSTCNIWGICSLSCVVDAECPYGGKCDANGCVLPCSQDPDPKCLSGTKCQGGMCVWDGNG